MRCSTLRTTITKWTNPVFCVELQSLEQAGRRHGITVTGNAFCKLPGFALGIVRPDLMHVLALGIRHWCLGCAIFEMVEAGRWHPRAQGPWEHVRAVQLRGVFRKLKDWAKARNLKVHNVGFHLQASACTGPVTDLTLKERQLTCWRSCIGPLRLLVIFRHWRCARGHESKHTLGLQHSRADTPANAHGA